MVLLALSLYSDSDARAGNGPAAVKILYTRTRRFP
jgi:hypothetical protein